MGEMSPEQRKELEEKIKNMSPEELQEFQRQQCVFCMINSGKVPAKQIYSDEKCIGILDINPASPGHVLLIPKAHQMVLPMMADPDVAHLFMAAKAISNSLLRILKAEGTTIFAANGGAAGQRAQHVVIHIIPRFSSDNVGMGLKIGKADEKQLESLASGIAQMMNQLLGKKVEAKNEPRQEAGNKEELQEEKNVEKPEAEPEKQEEAHHPRPEQKQENTEQSSPRIKPPDQKPEVQEAEYEEEPFDHEPDINEISKLLSGGLTGPDAPAKETEQAEKEEPVEQHEQEEKSEEKESENRPEEKTEENPEESEQEEEPHGKEREQKEESTDPKKPKKKLDLDELTNLLTKR